MTAAPYKKVSQGDIRGRVTEEIYDLLWPTFFENLMSFVQKMGGKVLKESKVRWAAILTFPNGRRIFLKRDRVKGRLQSLKYLLLPSKARKEWFIAYQSKKRHLNVPQPLGWIENGHFGFVRESFYLSEAVGSGVSFIEYLATIKGNSLADELAKTIRKIHDSGLFHKDLHAGNFIWDGQSFSLVDLHRAKIVKTLSLRQRMWNLSQLFHSLRSVWKEEDHLHFIEKYFEGDTVHLREKGEILRKIYCVMDRLQKKQWSSRTRRCLKESTEFSVLHERGIRYYHRRDFPIDHLKKVMEEHLGVVRKKSPALVKKSSDVIISIIGEGKNRMCVKQFCYVHLWDRLKDYFRGSKGLKSWIAGNGLISRGIPSLRPWALIEKRNWSGLRESLFIIEADESGLELDRYILKGFEDFGEKRLFIRTFAQWLFTLHKIKIYHKDMKTCNMMVSKRGETWNFYLLDLEDVSLNKEVSEKKLFKNLLQLNTSTPEIITRTGRFRFFKEYLRGHPIIENQKVFLRRLIEESKQRGLVYVSPQGVVIEKNK